MEVRALQLGDDRSAFRSGDPDLDSFLLKYAGQNQFRFHIGTTYVAVAAGRILGYVTVSVGEIRSEERSPELAARFPRYPLPVLRLVRLAVDQAARGLGIGKALLRFVLGMCLEQSARSGCIGVVVDAKPGAVDFYSRFEFTPLEGVAGLSPERPRPLPMFLALNRIRIASKP